MAINKEAKKLSSPTGKIQGSYLGINDLIAQVNEKKDGFSIGASNNDSADPFTPDELKINWRKFAHKSKDKGLDPLYNAMIARDPKIIKNLEIKYTVISDIQLNFIKSYETELLSYLKKELNNFSIKLTLEVEQAEEVKLYTNQDKFEDMAKRNPDLLLLRQKFKLDIDY